MSYDQLLVRLGQFGVGEILARVKVCLLWWVLFNSVCMSFC